MLIKCKYVKSSLNLFYYSTSILPTNPTVLLSTRLLSEFFLTYDKPKKSFYEITMIKTGNTIHQYTQNKSKLDKMNDLKEMIRCTL